MNDITCMLYVARFINILGVPNSISKNKVSGTYEYKYSEFSFTYCPIRRLHPYEEDGWEIEFYFYDTRDVTCFRDPEDFDKVAIELKAA